MQIDNLFIVRCGIRVAHPVMRETGRLPCHAFRVARFVLKDGCNRKWLRRRGLPIVTLAPIAFGFAPIFGAIDSLVDDPGEDARCRAMGSPHQMRQEGSP